METAIVTIINLFFVPMFATSIYAKRHQLLLNGSCARIISVYMMMTAALVPIMKGIVYLIDFCFTYKLKIDSGYYTLGAIIIAALLPYIAELFQKCFAVECEIEK